MFKKCLSVVLACSFLTGPLKTEEPSASYLKQAWNALKKKITTIVRYGDEQYKAICAAGSLVAIPTGIKLWLDRNNTVEQLLRDANGNIVSNSAELFDWIEKIRENGADVAKVIYGADLKKNEFFSNTGESFVLTFETETTPVSSTLEYKIMLGTISIIGLAALYSAYKLFNTPDKTPVDTTAEDKENSCA